MPRIIRKLSFPFPSRDSRTASASPADKHYFEGRTNVRFGPIASGKHVAKDGKLRKIFARTYGVRADSSTFSLSLASSKKISHGLSGSTEDSVVSEYLHGSKYSSSVMFNSALDNQYI
jgi:hypothetical protein